MTTPAAKVAGGRQVYSRDDLIRALRDYAELYGDDFTQAAFNPSTAKWQGRPEARERYLKGNPRTGRPWPALNTFRKAFGSWNAAREAAGFSPNSPGPRNRRPDGTVAPIRGVSDRVRVVTRVVERVRVDRDSGVRVDPDTERDLKRAVKRVEKLGRDLEKVNERLSATRERARGLDTKWRKARERADRQAATAATLREELREVRRTLHAQLTEHDPERAARLEAALRSDLAEAHDQLGRLTVELAAARERVELADEDELERQRLEVAAARERVSDARAAQDEAERDAAAADGARRAAEARASEAEAAATAERGQRIALQRAITGHDRSLTPADLAELRADGGPVGPAPFMEAVKAVLRATGNQPRREALRRVASAAVRWAERL